MGSFYQLIFFLSLVLLAIVITVYVLAVSLLGRAVRLSAQEQTEAEKKRKNDTENEIKKIQEQLEQAKAKGHVDIEGLWANLEDLERKESKHKWKLRWIRIKPKLLTATWGALIPGALFLISAIFSALAAYSQSATGTASQYMYVALTALGLGIAFICLTLKVVEGVAITSEETAFTREAEVLKTSLREVEDEKKPKLVLWFEETKPPFHATAESEISVEFTVGLAKGQIARRAFVYFYAPSNFTFLDSSAGPYPPGKYEGYVSTEFELGDIIRPLWNNERLKIRAPSEPNCYAIAYRIVCEESYTDIEEFEIEVKEAESPL